MVREARYQLVWFEELLRLGNERKNDKGIEQFINNLSEKEIVFCLLICKEMVKSKRKELSEAIEQLEDLGLRNFKPRPLA